MPTRYAFPDLSWIDTLTALHAERAAAVTREERRAAWAKIHAFHATPRNAPEVHS